MNWIGSLVVAQTEPWKATQVNWNVDWIDWSVNRNEPWSVESWNVNQIQLWYWNQAETWNLNFEGT